MKKLISHNVCTLFYYSYGMLGCFYIMFLHGLKTKLHRPSKATAHHKLSRKNHSKVISGERSLNAGSKHGCQKVYVQKRKDVYLGRFTFLNKIHQAKRILEVFTGTILKVLPYVAIFSHKSPQTCL